MDEGNESFKTPKKEMSAEEPVEGSSDHNNRSPNELDIGKASCRTPHGNKSVSFSFEGPSVEMDPEFRCGIVSESFLTPPPRGGNERTPTPGESAIDLDFPVEISPIAQSRDSEESGRSIQILYSDLSGTTTHKRGDKQQAGVADPIIANECHVNETCETVTTPTSNSTQFSDEKKIKLPENKGSNVNDVPKVFSGIKNSRVEYIDSKLNSSGSSDEARLQNNTSSHKHRNESIIPSDERASSVSYSGELSEGSTAPEKINFTDAETKEVRQDPSNSSGRCQFWSLNASSSRIDSDLSENEQKFKSYKPIHSSNVTTSELTQSLRDLSSARKQVGESSLEFIELIRSAAHRRKMEMTRSRDSLAAKEREQLLSLAASKLNSERTVQRARPLQSESKPQRTRSNPRESYKPFRARPLPRTTNAKGMGGLVGVPKVKKKPTTMPFSPLLGNRRQQKIRIKALDEPDIPPVKKQNSTLKNRCRQSKDRNVQNLYSPAPLDKSSCVPFKARPVPASIGSKGEGGQTGVPKVQKRPVTIPSSPCLGPRRRTSSGLPTTLNKSKSKKRMERAIGSKGTPGNASRILTDKSYQDNSDANASSSASTYALSKSAASMPFSSPLLGLNLLEMTPESANHTRSSGSENVTPRNAQIGGYQPHSTERAKKRAEFDARRDVRTQKREEEERENLQIQITQMHRELRKLRLGLCG